MGVDDNKPASVITDKVSEEQVLLAFRALPSTVAGTTIGIVFTLIALWPAVSHTALQVWAGLFMVVTILRGLQGIGDASERVTRKNIHKSIALFTTGTVVAAMMWASVSVFLFPVDDPVRQVILAFMFATTAAFAMANIASLRKTVLAFLVILLLPLAIRFFMTEHAVSTLLGVMVVIALLLFSVSALRIHQVIVSNIKSTRAAIESEDNLRQSQQRLALHIQQTPLAVIEWTPGLRVCEWNAAAENIFGYTWQEAVGKSANDLLVPDQLVTHVESVRAQIVDKSGGLYSINENRTRDGRIILCEWFNTPLIDAAGEVIGIASLARDVTERIKLDRIKNEFVSTVSHELRTPLTSLRGSLGLVLGGVVGELPDKVRDLLQIANNNAERLQRLINDILDIQRIESGQIEYHFETLSITQLVKQSIEENAGFALQGNIDIKLVASGDDMNVCADRDRLRQVMDNLLSNAIKFSHANSEVNVSLDRRGDHARVAIRDHGVGVPDEFRPRLFKQFTQCDASASRDFAGTGLGLSIAKGIIEQHQGKIAYEKPDGQGSCFYFDLSIV